MVEVRARDPRWRAVWTVVLTLVVFSDPTNASSENQDAHTRTKPIRDFPSRVRGRQVCRWPGGVKCRLPHPASHIGRIHPRGTGWLQVALLRGAARYRAEVRLLGCPIVKWAETWHVRLWVARCGQGRRLQRRRITSQAESWVG